MAFVDLSGFTSLVEAMGDQAAVQVLERFSSLVREQVSRWDGRVVKQIGDAFMLVFQRARAAVACAVDIGHRVVEEPHFFAARSGVQWGPVLYREADYIGVNVNVAARLASEAERHQVLVTASVRKAAGSMPDIEFVPLGRRKLKGLVDELELFEARRTERQRSHRLIDPVCGMELDPAEAIASLTFAGRERAFCSQQCLQQFVAAPERYAERDTHRG